MEKFVVSYGGGTNSTAVLIGMFERNIRPDLILFADTGSEKPNTYIHLESVQHWLKSVNFPPIVIVRNNLPKGVIDESLYGECLRLGTMPSKTFGYSTCSMKWKVEPQRKYIKNWMNNTGVKHFQHVIGFDADEEHRSKKVSPIREYSINRYLLIEWDWGRDECVKAIERSGLKQPGKSACFMCPSSKKHEVLWLKENEPDLYKKSIELEKRAINGEGQCPPARVQGLGRNFNWRTFAGENYGIPETDCGCHDG